MAVPACSKKRMKYILIHTWHPMQFTALRTLKPERRKFKNMLGMGFSHLPVISLRILLTAWPRWGDPLAYGGPSWRTYSDPLLQKASFMFMIDFWAKLPVFSLPCILFVQLALLKYFLVSCYSLFTLNFHGERCLWQEECAGILFWRLFLLLKLYVWAVQSSCSLPLQQCHQSTWAWQPSRPAGR